MNHSSALADLSSSKLVAVISVLGFAVVLLWSSEDIIHWKDLSRWTRTGLISNDVQGDDLSCLSRTQQAFYRKTKPASSELLDHWRKYAGIHQSCFSVSSGNWTQILNATTGSPDECKYLVYLEPGVGLGNRILSLVSALLYALLTDRVLLLDSRRDVSKLLCEPFSGSSWLLPLDFPYDAIDHAPNLGQAAEKKFEQLHIVHLMLFHIQSGGDKLFFCDETQESLTRVRVLAWDSNQYFVTSFFQIPSLWKKLVTLFPDHLGVFAQLTGLGVLPENKIWSLISRYHDSYLSNSRKLVGVQIRPHGRPNLAEYDPAVYRVILSCLTGHGLLPSLLKPSENASFSEHRAEVAVLVASLQGRYYESLRDVFLRNGSVKLVSFQTLSTEGAEMHNLHQASLALAEMWLLSFGDEIVTSGYSTFGYVAHGAASKRPWIMNIRGTSLDQDNSSASCYLSHSTEPCTHFPQKPGCEMNLTTEHRSWIEARIGGCQDHSGGIQLLN